MIYKEHILLIE